MVLAFAKALGDEARWRPAATASSTPARTTASSRSATASPSPGSQRADLFVSIHANSFPGNSVRGAIVYTVSDEASDKMAAALAESENQSDALAGIDVDARGFRSGEGHPRRPDPARDAQFRRRLRAEPGQGTLGTATRMFKIPAPAGELQGAGGAGRALGADRTRLPHQRRPTKSSSSPTEWQGNDGRARSSARSTTTSREREAARPRKP